MFSDGRVATNLDQHPFAASQTAPTGPLLLPTGGTGSERWSHTHYWVWPLPLSGPLTFMCEWPIHGIAQSRAAVDAALIRDAATRPIALWPDDEPPQQ